MYVYIFIDIPVFIIYRIAQLIIHVIDCFDSCLFVCSGLFVHAQCSMLCIL